VGEVVYLLKKEKENISQLPPRQHPSNMNAFYFSRSRRERGDANEAAIHTSESIIALFRREEL
jgi:hypothetical protein